MSFFILYYMGEVSVKWAILHNDFAQILQLHNQFNNFITDLFITLPYELLSTCTSVFPLFVEYQSLIVS